MGAFLGCFRASMFELEFQNVAWFVDTTIRTLYEWRNFLRLVKFIKFEFNSLFRIIVLSKKYPPRYYLRQGRKSVQTSHYPNSESNYLEIKSRNREQHLHIDFEDWKKWVNQKLCEHRRKHRKGIIVVLKDPQALSLGQEVVGRKYGPAIRATLQLPKQGVSRQEVWCPKKRAWLFQCLPSLIMACWVKKFGNRRRSRVKWIRI